MGAATGTGVRHRVGAYAALVRLPNLFTAPPDVLLGAALAEAAGANPSPSNVAIVAVASMFLYAGGTTLNDYFDADVDAEERPERPIPSGRVVRRTALALGVGLLSAGTLVAAGTTASAGGIAALIAVTVLLYDGVLKGGSMGFLAMGSARGLNVLLGVAGAAGLGALPPWAWIVPVAIVAYIAAVTFMAAEEAGGADRSSVVVAAGGAALAAVAVPITLVMASTDALEAGLGVAFAAGFLTWTGRALLGAYRDPVPETIGPAVGTCVLGLIVLDAAFATIGGVNWSVLALAFLLPAVGLARVFDVS